jgi:hypothetical protein
MTMNMESYIAIQRRWVSQLESDRSAITERGARLFSRWGYYQPFIETTRGMLAELDRRIKELMVIVTALEHGRLI